MTEHITQTYQILDEIAHVRQRTGIYAGSIITQKSNEWIFDNNINKMIKKEIDYIPAFIKIISEILDNSIDEYKRHPDILTQIKVSIKNGTITIQDNGSGIPVEIHPETNQYIAEMVFSNLRAGSNFNDDEDQSLIGTNGIGSTLTSILSSHFKVESCDGKKSYKQEFWNGLRERSEPIITKSDKHGTKTTFTPDYEFFKLDGLTQGHFDKIYKKVIDAASCNPKVKFYFNDELIKIKSFDDYIALYNDEFCVDSNDNWNIGIAHSDGYEQISFVNAVETYMGGTHVEYVSNQIVSKLREYITKKHKIDVKPADIKNHLRIFVSCNINRPRFSSQTKENMVSPLSEWKTSWLCSDKFINKILKTEIIQSVLDWVKAKEDAIKNAELRKASKELSKTDPKTVPKFSDATTKNRSEAMLFILEGDCLEENTEVLIQDNSLNFYYKKIKDVSINDKVLTHNGNIKHIINKQHRLKSTVKIKTKIGNIEASKDHKLYVYNTLKNEFEFLSIRELDKNIHKLVKSKIGDCQLTTPILDKINIEETNYDLEFNFKYTDIDNNISFLKSSNTHKHPCYDLINHNYTILEAKDININQHTLLFKG